MKIIIYGDSFVFGGGLYVEYAINKGYIDQYDHNKFFNLNKELQEESMNYVINNRWSSLLEKELNIKIENCGFPGAGWQYIEYSFLKNELNNEEEVFYIFCPPTNEIKRLLISNDCNELSEKINIVNYKRYTNNNFSNFFNILNLYDNQNQTYENIFLNALFTKKVTDQLNFQNVFNLLNYLIMYKKKFIFLPSWFDSNKDSFIINAYKENKSFYDQYVFKYINYIKINNFWCNDKNNKLSSGHPNLLAQEKIKNDYIKIIKDYF
jgi:hypothetical protein